MKKIFVVFFLNLVLISCGYKVVDKTSQRNFYIAETINSGDSRINFKIKNKLLFNNPKNEKNILSLNINSNKKKIIYEKNEKNEITKYKINVIIKVKFNEVIDQISEEFEVSATKILNVQDKQFSTLNRERRLVDLICDDLAVKILDEISIRIK
tara:strand:- start:227 stop:688 length:462 start_codon:yes stop_codon:yes gene_type:complete